MHRYRDRQLNRRAWQRVESMIAHAEELRIGVHTLACGTRIVDCGVRTHGGFAAGREFAAICMGDLGHVTWTETRLGERSWPGVLVTTDHPVIACLAAQYAGWRIRMDTFFAMASGPGRALVRAESLFERIGYTESSDVGVLCLETRTLPDETVARTIAERMQVSPDALVLLVAPTASIVGSVQIAARSVETALHKIEVMGYDVHQFVSGIGVCPLPPVAPSDAHAIGRANDAILYGARVTLFADGQDDTLEEIAQRLPSATSPHYGQPFYTVLERHAFDFYQIDPLLFSPAAVVVHNLRSGRTFHAGRVNVSVLEASFFG